MHQHVLQSPQVLEMTDLAAHSETLLYANPRLVAQNASCFLAAGIPHAAGVFHTSATKRSWCAHEESFPFCQQAHEPGDILWDMELEWRYLRL
jgi:hypothetical protein